MRKQLQIAILVSIIFVGACKPSKETITPKEPLVLLSKVKNPTNECLFIYDDSGKLIELQLNGTPVSYRFSISYLPDGKLNLINTEVVGAQKGSYKFIWSSPTEATIEGVPLFITSKITMKLQTDTQGKPLDIKRTSPDGILLSNQYTYKYDSKGNRTEIGPDSNIGKVSESTLFDDKKSPYAPIYQVITLIDAFDNIGWNFLFTQPFGAVNNALNQKRGNTMSWTYKYLYNSAGYPIELDAEYRDTKFTPVRMSASKFTFEYISK